MKQQFYRCPVCGNIIEKMFDSGVTPECCGQPMEVLQPNITDGKHEYHVPVAEPIGDNQLRVTIGQEPHPMTEEHHIQFITLETCDCDNRCGNMSVWLKPDDKPEYTFTVCPKNVVSVFAYCNLHGLWKLDCANGNNCTNEKSDNEMKDGSSSNCTKDGSATNGKKGCSTADCKSDKEVKDGKDPETCGTYPAYCGMDSNAPKDQYYSCD